MLTGLETYLPKNIAVANGTISLPNSHTYRVSRTHKNGEVGRVIILAYGGYICVTG